ncbi:MAG: hypothetical protein HY952_01235 [Elusimicrobia bacterium]|nr:hypothetical protein [Elusimicrobiota bacterium]
MNNGTDPRGVKLPPLAAAFLLLGQQLLPLVLPFLLGLFQPYTLFAAETEVMDRLVVNGTGIFKSTSTFEKQLAVGTTVITSTLTVRGGVSVSTSATANVLFFVHASSGAVGIATIDPTERLEVNGNVKALRFFGDGSALTNTPGVPIGAIALFDGACPTDWTELAAAQGRYLVGNPSGGALSGTLGTAMTNLADASYTPAGAVAAPVFTGTGGTTGSESAHTHGMQSHTHTTDIASFSSGAEASHTHAVGTGPSATWCTSRTAAACSGQADYGNAGNTFQASGTSAHTHGNTSAGSSHSHTVDPPATASGGPSTANTAAGSAHSHSFTPAGTNTAPAFTGTANNAMRSSIAPYIQLRLCKKTSGQSGVPGNGWEDTGPYVVANDISDNVGIGTVSPLSKLTIGGGALQMNATTSPGNSPAATGRIYFDSATNKFKVSENGINYVDLVQAGMITGSGTPGTIPKFATSSSLSDSVLLEASSDIGIGRAPGSVGAAKLELYGTDSNLAGPHFQAVTSLDNYPVFQQLNWTHDNIGMYFDSYYDGSQRSSDAGSNFQIYKNGDYFGIRYASGYAQGSAIIWSSGLAMDSSGRVGIGTTPDTTVKLHVAGKLRVDQSTVSVNGTDMFFIPSGIIMLFDGSACPSGWTEITSVRNRIARGWDGATPAGDANIGGSDTHSHTTDVASFTTGSEAAHTHAVGTGPSATWCTSRTAAACSGQADYGNAGNTFQASGTSAHTHGNTSAGSSHSHSADPPIATSSTNSNLPAYRAFLFCKKN